MTTNTPQEEPIPADFLEWAKEYAEKVYSDTPRSFRDHLHAELMCALGTAYRKLSQKAAPGVREAMADAYKLIKSGYWHNAADVLFTALNPNPFTPAAPSKPIEEEKPEQGCTKPNCDCIDRAEEHAGGPVKSYPCLHPGRELNEAKKPASPSPTEVPEEIMQLASQIAEDICAYEIDGASIKDVQKDLAWRASIAMYHKMKGQIDVQKINIEGLLASNKEWGEKYGDVSRQLDQARNCLMNIRCCRSAFEMVGYAKSYLAKYPSSTNTEQTK